ncbi:MAG: NAD(P)-dependent oxidoreductase [Planctomycetes bacterium]|nr:NAD(P)-dependent oxidoreductase [Planctomycetota bacterium]
MDESVPPSITGHAYADSKILGEKKVWSALEGSKTEGVIVRVGMVYGPGSQFWSVRLVNVAKLGYLFLINGGRGHAYPIYIDDLIDGILLAATHSAGANRIFNFANEEPITWEQWLTDYARICGHESVLVINMPIWLVKVWFLLTALFTGSRRVRHIEVMTRQGVISNETAKNVLGWYPRVGYHEGMRRTALWLRSAGIT